MDLKPFGRKAHEFAYRHPSQDKRINILYGAVRSSKTFAMIPKIMALLVYPVAGDRLFTGVSKQTVFDNVLSPIFDFIGPNAYHYNRQSGEANILGVKWSVLGARDEGSEKFLRGRTVGIAYGDELTLMPKSFFDMLMARMSPENSRFYATTNQDTPFHYVKADILDNPDLVHSVWSQHFTLNDNPNLTKEYKDFVKRMYTGVFYRRFILGEWVQATGAVYGGLINENALYDDTTRPIGLLHPNGHMKRVIAVDAGTANAQVYGDYYDTGSAAFCENMYYWDSVKEGRQKTNGEYADDLVNGCPEMGWPGIGKDSRNWPDIITDPSAASFQAELRSRGLVVRDGDNDVDEGIRRTASMIGRGKLRLHREHCKRGIIEMENYSWDEKRTDKGKDTPLKKKDHFPDQARYYVNTEWNDWRIAA
jgi:PBSX family phage terminase large subunit